ncbi:MAG TPA: SDR family oxidoreductase, partial [Pirellulaceae bacterium]|nr:SDR family oxidoreductase [Pirellulaceae bacterium]
LVIVERLLAAGWLVTAVQRTLSNELRQLVQDHAARLRLFAFDLQQIELIDEQFRHEWFPDDMPVTGLVNNAAIAYDDLLTNLDLQRLESMFRINVHAPQLLTKLVVRRMLLHGCAGSLVHVSSVAAHTGFKGLSMYGATKGALEAFSRGVAREWGSRGIRSNCVVPGFMETDMSRDLSEEQRNKIYQRTALKKPTDPRCIAEMVEFLLSEKSRSMTGQNVNVQG